MLANFFQDFRYAVRTFRKDAGFTIAALLTIGLGIGASTAVFSVIEGAVLHPIPFAEPDRLVSLYQKYAHEERNSVSYLNLLDWQQRTQTLEGVAGLRSDTFTLTGRGEPEQVMALTVSWNLLAVLRAEPLLGRMFTREEDKRGGAPVTLLGEAYWKRRFGGDPKILGQSLRLSGRDYTVIGVVPASVRFERAPKGFVNDVFTPIAQNANPLFYERGVGDNTIGLGRLRPGVALAQARAEMDTIMANLAAEYPDADKDTGVSTFSYQDELTGSLRPVLTALAAAVSFVLLIACTNVANLMLARSASRTQEFGVRIALGAQRGRLIRQLLTESVLLSLAGGVLGLLIASWCTGATLAVLPTVIPAISDVDINRRVLLFSLALALLTGIFFGLVPAWKVGGTRIGEALRESGRGIVRAPLRPQYILVAAEVTLTFVLLASAGLLIRSIRNLWNVDPGFNPRNTLVFYSSLSPQRSATPEATREAFQELSARINALPGVEATSLDVGGLPFFGDTGMGFATEDDPQTSTRAMRLANVYWTGNDHFKAMGIRLMRGRFFTDQDTERSLPVAVMDEDSARRVFEGKNPIGQYIRMQLNDRPIEIVGIAGRVKHGSLDPDANRREHAQLYFPIRQLPDSLLLLGASGFAGIVRSSSDSATLLKFVRKEINSFDGGAVFGEQSMTDAIAGSLAPRRFSLILLGAFAGVALILSITGIYGVVSYLISQRTNEIGLRMTLGAHPSDVFMSVLREGAIVGIAGIALGLAGAAALTRLLASLLFGIRPMDLITLAGAAVVLFCCTILACFIPARRAVRVDPATALRCN